MTISDADWRRYENTTEDFQPQTLPDQCLPIALKNVLDEMADRLDYPGLSFSISDLEDICNYQEGMGSSAEEVPHVLGAEIEEIGFTVKTQINMSLGDLDEKIEKGTCSYPLVELDPDYFDTIENWSPTGSRHGRSFPHIVIPFKINTEKVLYYDPFGAIMMRSGAVSTPKRTLDQSDFFTFWSGRAHPRWTMWIEQLEQQTLEASLSNT